MDCGICCGNSSHARDDNIGKGGGESPLSFLSYFVQEEILHHLVHTSICIYKVMTAIVSSKVMTAIVS